MMAAQQKKLVEFFGIFESLLIQNPTNQDSHLSLFFQMIWKAISKSKNRDSRKIFLPENDFKICFTKLLMPFIVFQIFKVKLLLENFLWRNILIHLKTSNSPEPRILAFCSVYL